METSIMVNIVLCILSFILAAISVVTVVITLRQNSKMIEASSRPYLSMYVSHIFCTDCIDYLVLKNFGNSSAIIKNFECNTDLSVGSYDVGRTPFEHIVEQTICPGQSLNVPLRLHKICSHTSSLSFLIEYSSGRKLYKDNICINLEALSDASIMSADPNGRELEAISRSLQDICEKML